MTSGIKSSNTNSGEPVRGMKEGEEALELVSDSIPVYLPPALVKQQLCLT